MCSRYMVCPKGGAPLIPRVNAGKGRLNLRSLPPLEVLIYNIHVYNVL